MSLDVYLSEDPDVRCTRCGTILPGARAGDLLYSANITHNLGAMADAAGVYYALWRPGEHVDATARARIREQREVGNWHGPGGVYEIEASLPTVRARDIVPALRDGLALLKTDPARFEKFNAPNGWGLYEHFVPFVERYLAACEEHPTAIVTVSR